MPSDPAAFLAALPLLRLRIADTNPAEQLLSDLDLECVWDAAPGPWTAAADALDIIAVSEVLISKKIRTQDLTTDGPAVATELRNLAKGYRARAAAEGEIDGDPPDIFEIVDTITSTRRPEHTNPQVWGL